MLCCRLLYAYDLDALPLEHKSTYLPVAACCPLRSLCLYAHLIDGSLGRIGVRAACVYRIGLQNI